MRQATQRLRGVELLIGDKQDQSDTVHDGAKKKPTRRPPAPDDVGRVLRTAYEEALREDVPDDFMDLLGKLS